jgi:hypothetical protein
MVVLPVGKKWVSRNDITGEIMFRLNLQRWASAPRGMRTMKTMALCRP